MFKEGAKGEEGYWATEMESDYTSCSTVNSYYLTLIYCLFCLSLLQLSELIFMKYL